ncbi:MAG: glycoside hydrolase family 13 protein, partial [Oscillospiraceae bacterium]
MRNRGASKGLDSVMNYPFRVAVLNFIKNGDGDNFCESILKICENYPKEALDTAWNSLSTHDTPRAMTFLCAEDPDSTDRYWQDGRV